MSNFLNEDTSIYLQIAQMLERDILNGIFAEGERVPSTNELAKAYTINPATAAKGVSLLVDEGILFKKRGVGMFISEGAKGKIMEKRQEAFREHYVIPLLTEAKALAIPREEVASMILKTNIELSGGHHHE